MSWRSLSNDYKISCQYQSDWINCYIIVYMFSVKSASKQSKTPHGFTACFITHIKRTCARIFGVIIILSVSQYKHATNVKINGAAIICIYSRDKCKVGRFSNVIQVLVLVIVYSLYFLQFFEEKRGKNINYF